MTEPSDLFNSCFTFDPNILTPTNFRGSQAPHSGNGYAGFQAQNDQFSDPRAGYVQIQLTTPLVAGNHYDLSFWVSQADNYGTGMGGLGAHFSVDQVAPGDYSPLNNHGISPQIASDIFIHITDAVNWTQITGTYTAVGGETHITLGNFKTTFSPPSPLVTYICCGSSLSYYYIDDVSLVPNLLLPVQFSAFTATPRQDVIDLEWTTGTEINSSHFVIERSQDGLLFEDIGEHPAAINSSEEIDYQWPDLFPQHGSNYYRIKEVDQEGNELLSDIVLAEYGEPASSAQINVSVDQSHLNYEYLIKEPIGIQTVDGKINIDIIDMMGRSHLEEEIAATGTGQGYSGYLPIDHLKQGVYFIRFTLNGHIVTKKFLLIR